MNLSDLRDAAVALIVQTVSYDVDQNKTLANVIGTCDRRDVAEATNSMNVSMSNGETFDPLLSGLNKILCNIVQGSVDPLSVIAPHARNIIRDLMIRSLDAINSSLESIKVGSDLANVEKLDISDLSSRLLSRYPNCRILQSILSCKIESDEILLLGDVIKTLGIRECHGARGKDAIGYEDTELLSIWSWEVNKTSVFSPAELSIIKECQSNRRRYGRTVKAYMSIVDQVEKIASLDDTKVLQAEEKASKAFADVEKAKEKRMESDRKKQQDRADKVMRDQAKEQLLREKEEKLRRRKEEAALEAVAAVEIKRAAEARALEEKAAIAAEKKFEEERAAKKIEKQRNLMQNFLCSRTAIRNSVPTSSGVSIPSVGTVSVADPPCSSFNAEKFEMQVSQGSLPKSEILKLHRERYLLHKSNPLKRHKKVVEVPVEVGCADGFGSESYTEFVGKSFGRMKLFQFHDYEKTKYWGTYSKKSTVINGRTFFKKDEALRNYDVDSAEEWDDEEEVGEDIIDSDDDNDCDEHNEPNELVYDEFFRHDDDFGSDADEETGELRRAIISRTAVVSKSTSGPRFVFSSPILHRTPLESSIISPSNAAIDSAGKHIVAVCCSNNGGNFTHCDDSDKDVSRLTQYFTVVYPEVVENTFCCPNLEAHVVPVPGPADEFSGIDKTKILTCDQTRTFAAFIHGKKWGLDKIVDALKNDFPSLSKNFIKRTIMDMATKEKGPNSMGSFRWIIKSELVSEFQIGVPIIEYTPPKLKKRITPVLTEVQACLLSEIPIQNSKTVLTNSSSDQIELETETTCKQVCIGNITAIRESLSIPAQLKCPSQASIASFFIKHKASAAADIRCDVEPMFADDVHTNEDIKSPPYKCERLSNENENSPLDFEIFDRLVGTPSTTPLARGNEISKAANQIGGSSQLFGEADNEDLMLLDLTPASPSTPA